jgi:hypothetical protein
VIASASDLDDRRRSKGTLRIKGEDRKDTGNKLKSLYVLVLRKGWAACRSRKIGEGQEPMNANVIGSIRERVSNLPNVTSA